MSNAATSAPEPGQILAGKYLVEEVLGVGGMGVVVSAKHLQLDQRVAIKYLLPAALLNPEVVERFAREARAAAKIRGEHVARVIDVGQFDDGAPYMVMEHLEGHDLAKHLETNGPLPIENAIRYLLETCEALAEAHAAKIVHRDLKPSNMFLARQPDKSAIIKVLDFGISKTGDAPSASLTKTSALMGTAFYMSPEQLTTPKAVDHRSDIWSLGVILYELLAGRQPFIGESVPEIIGGILQNHPDPLRSLRPEVPEGLEAVIAKCMKSKAADRYQSVASLAAALGPFAHARDRMSIEITARVLGESLRPEALPPTVQKTVMMPPSAMQQTGPRTPMPAQMPPAVTTNGAHVVAAAEPSGPSPVAAVTTHGLSTSTITPKPKRSPLAFVGIALVIGVVGTGLGIKLTAGPSPTQPSAAAGGGLVAPPQAEPPKEPAAQNAPSKPPTTILPATAAEPATPDPAPAASTTKPAGAAAAVPPAVQARPAAPGEVKPGPAAAPAKSAVVASATPASAPPPPSAAPATQPAAPATPSKNPLNMGIK